MFRICDGSCCAAEAACLAISSARLLNKSPEWPLTFIKLSDCVLVQVSRKICSIIIEFGVLVYWRTFHSDVLALFILSMAAWESVNILIVVIHIGIARIAVHMAISSAFVDEGQCVEVQPYLISS